MEYHAERTGTTIIFTLAGRIDSAGSLVMDAAIKNHVVPSDTAVLIDMAGISYISSAGIRIIAALDKALRARGGYLCLCTIQPAVMKVLRITGHDRIFSLCPTREEGISRCRGASPTAAGSPVPALAHTRLVSDTLPDYEAVLKITGDGKNVPGQVSGADDLIPRVFAPTEYSAGIGAPGESAAGSIEDQGLLLTLKGSLFWKPFAASNDPPDFLIPKDDAPRILLQTAFSLSADSAFHEILTAEPQQSDGFTLGDLCSDMIRHAKSACHNAKPIMSIVMYAGTSGTGGPGTAVFPAGYERADPQENRTLVAFGTVIDRSADLSSYDPGLLTMILSQNTPASADRDMFLYLYGLVFDRPPAFLSRDIVQSVAAIVEEESPSDLGLLSPGIRFSRAMLGVTYISALTSPGSMPVRIAGDCPGWNRTYETITRWMHPGCREVVLTPLSGGYSGTLVFRVRARDANGRSMMPLVMKLGAWPLIEPEIRGYTYHVKRYIQNNATQIIETERIGDYGGILYNFVGVRGAESTIFSLEDYYLSHTADEILPVIDSLFRVVLNGWYGEPKKRMMALYREYDRFWKYDAIRAYAAEQFGAVPGEPEIDLPFGLGRSVNPLWFVETVMPARSSQVFPVYESSVHCDLNMRNVLMDETKNLWLIDFADTKYSHILRDIIKLEAVIKGEMVPVHSRDTLEELARADALFLAASVLSDIPHLPAAFSDPAMEKAFRVVQELRRHADRITLEDEDITQYYLGLLPYT